MTKTSGKGEQQRKQGRSPQKTRPPIRAGDQKTANSMTASLPPNLSYPPAGNGTLKPHPTSNIPVYNGGNWF
jgi:hypothetical protein